MVYSFARIGAALGMAVEDVYARHRIELSLRQKRSRGAGGALLIRS